jgi:DNA (cytosine-5)-methyltransferase 1
MLTYLAIAARYRPTWLVWENVPGALSVDEGRAFASLIGGMAELGYHASWRVLDAQYIVVDGYSRAVPQRRNRVFVVGHLGDWRRAAAVFLEPESLSGNPPPRREAGKVVAPTISARTSGGGGLGTDFDCDGGLIADVCGALVNSGGNAYPGQTLQDATAGQLIAYGGNNTSGPIEVAAGLNAKSTQRQDFESETFITTRPVAASEGRGAESAGKGGSAGRRQEDDDNLVATPYTLAIRGRDGAPDLEYRQDGTANAILTPNGGRAGMGVGAIAPEVRPINTMVGLRHEALGERTGLGIGNIDDPAFTLSKAHSHAVQQGWAVRRLTPRECERLQGFPDDFTNIPWRGKPEAPDGPRYKALGNSMACNVMRFIGQRIQMVEDIAPSQLRSAA